MNSLHKCDGQGLEHHIDSNDGERNALNDCIPKVVVTIIFITNGIGGSIIIDGVLESRADCFHVDLVIAEAIDDTI